MTAYPSEPPRPQILKDGARAYFEKPLDIAKLLVKIKFAMEKQGQLARYNPRHMPSLCFGFFSSQGEFLYRAIDYRHDEYADEHYQHSAEGRYRHRHHNVTASAYRSKHWH